MKWFLMILTVCLALCGCHSKKHVVEQADSESSVVKGEKETVWSIEASTILRYLQADSVTLTVSADSLRTTAGIVFQPRLRVKVHRPEKSEEVKVKSEECIVKSEEVIEKSEEVKVKSDEVVGGVGGAGRVGVAIAAMLLLLLWYGQNRR